MKRDADFWFGMGAGMTAGILMGVMMPDGNRSMKTHVGKGIQKLGIVVDHTVDNLTSNFH